MDGPHSRPLLVSAIVLLVVALLAVPTSATLATDGSTPTAEDGPDAGLPAENVTIENVTVRTGTHGLGERLSNRSAIRDAAASGDLSSDGFVLRDETVVVTIQVAGLAARFRRAERPNETARFFAAVEGPNSTIALHQTNPTHHRLPKTVLLNRTAATSVVADPRNDTYHLVVSIADAPVERSDFEDDGWSGGDGLTVERGEEYRLDVTLFGRTPPDADTDRSARYRRPDLQILEGAVGFGEGGELELVTISPGRDQEIRAKTTLAPGTAVTVSLENRSDGGATLVDRTVVYESPGDPVDRYVDNPLAHDLRASVDATDVTVGTSFDVVVEANGRTVVHQSGLVQNGSAAVTMPATEDWADGVIAVSSARLPAAGFLVVQAGDRERLSGPCSPLYRGHVAVDAGTHDDRSIPISTERLSMLTEPLPRQVTLVAVADANDNGVYDGQDRPYVDEGRMAVAVAVVQNPERASTDVDLEAACERDPTHGGPVVSDPPTPTTRVNTTTVTATRTPGSASSPAPSPTTTASSGPGFTVVAGLVAVLLAVAVRRRGEGTALNPLSRR
jgi:PGF-CTERM protein